MCQLTETAADCSKGVIPNHLRCADPDWVLWSQDFRQVGCCMKGYVPTSQRYCVTDTSQRGPRFSVVGSSDICTTRREECTDNTSLGPTNLTRSTLDEWLLPRNTTFENFGCHPGFIHSIWFYGVFKVRAYVSDRLLISLNSVEQLYQGVYHTL